MKRKNENMILRYLYHNRGEFCTRREIEDGTGLSEAQVRYALNDIIQYVDRRESETRGDIQNAYVYSINSDGREYVSTEIDEVPQEQENAEELDKLRKEVMILSSRVNDISDELEEWKQYNSRWNDVAENKLNEFERQVENIDELLSDS